MIGSMIAAPTVVPSFAQIASSDNNIMIDGDFEAGGSAWSEGRLKSIADGVSYGDGKKSGKLPENNGNSYIGQIVKIEQNIPYQRILKLAVKMLKLLLQLELVICQS